MALKIESATTSESADNIRNFLNGHYTGTLATADAAANPHVSVVYFSTENDFSLTFGTKRETQKFKNIEENNDVAFLVYDEKEQTVVQVFGRAEIVTDESLRSRIFSNMVSSSSEGSQTEIPPAEKLLAGDYVAVRIVPMVIKMAVYARPNPEGDELYDTLLFSGE